MAIGRPGLWRTASRAATGALVNGIYGACLRSVVPVADSSGRAPVANRSGRIAERGGPASPTDLACKCSGRSTSAHAQPLRGVERLAHETGTAEEGES